MAEVVPTDRLASSVSFNVGPESKYLSRIDVYPTTDFGQDGKFDYILGLAPKLVLSFPQPPDH